MLLIVIRFALLTLCLTAALVATVDVMRRGQTNSQWNTMGDDEVGWLTTSNDDGGDGPRSGGRRPPERVKPGGCSPSPATQSPAPQWYPDTKAPTPQPPAAGERHQITPKPQHRVEPLRPETPALEEENRTHYPTRRKAP